MRSIAEVIDQILAAPDMPRKKPSFQFGTTMLTGKIAVQFVADLKPFRDQRMKVIDSTIDFFALRERWIDVEPTLLMVKISRRSR